MLFGGEILMSMSFFAASNSADGFKNYYKGCFERVDRLFIIKGGPGTGKSTFMRRAADMAEARGGSVERYYCSSDHTSLDGVIFDCGGETVGMIDGTFPHPYIERLPGVREEIVNTGAFWDRKMLKKNGDKIRELSQKKSLCYDRAYEYLRACGNLNEVYNSYGRSKINTAKMNGAVDRLMRALPDGQSFCADIALVNCIGMLGRAHLDTFERESDKIYLIVGDYGGEEYLRMLLEAARRKKLRVRVSQSPIYYRELDGIYLEESRLWFVKEAALPELARETHRDKIRLINMGRFQTSEGQEQNKKEIKYCKKLLTTCVAGAESELERAGIYHFELEQIYKSAMDFERLEAFTLDFCREIFCDGLADT